ncbi:C-24(28) sterol reductase [Fusarium graminearum]
MSSRYSLRQTPRKKELFEGMVETPIRRSRSARRQTSQPLSDVETDSTVEILPQPTEVLPNLHVDELPDSKRNNMGAVNRAANGKTNGHANGNGNGYTNGHGNGNGHATNGHATSNGAAPIQAVIEKTKGVSHDPHVVDGWRPGQDPKVDYSGEVEFGGSLVLLL